MYARRSGHAPGQDRKAPPEHLFDRDHADRNGLGRDCFESIPQVGMAALEEADVIRIRGASGSRRSVRGAGAGDLAQVLVELGVVRRAAEVLEPGIAGFDRWNLQVHDFG